MQVLPQLRLSGLRLPLGQRISASSRQGQARVCLLLRAARAGQDPRCAVERSAAADGCRGQDARLLAHVLGKENSGVDCKSRTGAGVWHQAQRQVAARFKFPRRAAVTAVAADFL